MRNCIALLVAVGAFLIGSGVYHQYTAASEANTAGNEATYAGRTFDEWCTLSVNDLDSATRAQAFKAFAAFASHGKKKESFAAIKAGLAREKSRLEIKEGYAALRNLGQIGLPALIVGLKHDDTFHRLAALEPFNSYRSPVSEDAVSAVADAIRDDSVKIRVLTCSSLGKMAMSSELDFSKSPPAAIRPEGVVGPITVRVVPVLCTALTDKDTSVRMEALQALSNLGTRARSGARDVVHYFEGLVADLTSSERARSQSRNPEVQAALKTLYMIGPEASDAVPLLNKLAEVRGYKNYAERVIAKFQPEP